MARRDVCKPILLMYYVKICYCIANESVQEYIGGAFSTKVCVCAHYVHMRIFNKVFMRGAYIICSMYMAWPILMLCYVMLERESCLLNVVNVYNIICIHDMQVMYKKRFDS
jgi:hypothetical protein